jgi:hypothetical protein
MTIVDELLQKHPLVRFSLYTSIQANVLTDLGETLLSNMDQSLAEDGKVQSPFNDFYGKFWLWTIGAYEVVRTMAGAKHCFVPDAHERVVKFKHHIATLRMPFAKQQLRGKDHIINAEASISGFDFPRRDVVFEVDGARVSARTLIEDFLALIKGIRLSDILQDLRDPSG